MNGFWAVFWLALILKIPIVALLYLVWYAIRQPPVPEADQDDGGGARPGPRVRGAVRAVGGGARRKPHHRHFTPPPALRRAPLANPPHAAPERVRVTTRGPRVPS